MTNTSVWATLCVLAFLVAGIATAADISTKDTITYSKTTDGKTWDALKEGELASISIGTVPTSFKFVTTAVAPVVQIIPKATVVAELDEKHLTVVQHNTQCYQGYYGVSESLTSPWTAYWYVDLDRTDIQLVYATWKPRSVYVVPISYAQFQKNIVDPVKAGNTPNIATIMEMVKA
jgi:hypothetical protein